MVNLPRKLFCQFLIKLNLNPSYNPAIRRLGSHPQVRNIHITKALYKNVRGSITPRS